MRVKKVPTSETEYQYLFVCPGCNQEHAFNETTWMFNGDMKNPTINPSFLIHGSRFDKDGNTVNFLCHSFIANGNIRYLSDCTHRLKGEIVNLPDTY